MTLPFMEIQAREAGRKDEKASGRACWSLPELAASGEGRYEWRTILARSGPDNERRRRVPPTIWITSTIVAYAAAHAISSRLPAHGGAGPHADAPHARRNRTRIGGITPAIRKHAARVHLSMGGTIR